MHVGVPHLLRRETSLFNTTNPCSCFHLVGSLPVLLVSATTSLITTFLMEDLSVAIERSTRNQGSPDPDKQAFQLIMACARGDLAAVQRLVETERVPVTGSSSLNPNPKPHPNPHPHPHANPTPTQP